MPTYEYICEACEHEFEEFQSMSAGPLRKCPSCAKLRLRRKIGTGAGIIFKGSGFYETDYRSDGYKKAEKAEKDSSAGAGTAAKSEGTTGGTGGSNASSVAAPAKSESKPAAKAGNKPANAAKTAK